jgi:hypothetical protein
VQTKDDQWAGVVFFDELPTTNTIPQQDNLNAKDLCEFAVLSFTEKPIQPDTPDPIWDCTILGEVIDRDQDTRSISSTMFF